MATARICLLWAVGSLAVRLLVLVALGPMAPLYDELHAALGVTGGRRVQMLGRLGYGERVAPSPRWPLATRIRPT